MKLPAASCGELRNLKKYRFSVRSLGRMRSLWVFKSMLKGIYKMKRLLILVLLLAVAGCATLEKGQSEKTYKKKDRHSEHRH